MLRERQLPLSSIGEHGIRLSNLARAPPSFLLLAGHSDLLDNDCLSSFSSSEKEIESIILF